MLTDRQTETLEKLYNFYLLWKDNNWKCALKNEDFTNPEYEELVTLGLAKTRKTQLTDETRGFATEFVHCENDKYEEFQINDAGIAAWKETGKVALLTKTLGLDVE